MKMLLIDIEMCHLTGALTLRFTSRFSPNLESTGEHLPINQTPRFEIICNEGVQDES